MSNARKLGSLFGASGSIDPLHGGAPAGVVLPFAGSAAPTGWLLCFGQAISRTTYAALFAAIGTAYGAGDGSTTFNLPDLRGRVPGGLDTMGGTAANRLTAAGGGVNGAALGAAGGGETHTLTTAQMPAHTHANTLNDPGHVHSMGFQLGGTAGGGAANQAGTFYTGTPTNTQSAGTGISINNASQGSGGAHPNVQPTLVLNYIIKAA